MMIEAIRSMSPAQKFERVASLNAAVRQLAAARIREQYQPATEREVRLRVAALWLDDETMRRAFGWDPALQGR